VQFAYAIGVAEPVSMLVETYGTGTVSDEKLTAAVLKTFDARPGMLIKELDLRRPIFRKTAAYGHFGREEPEFTWEKTPLVDKLKASAGGPAKLPARLGSLSGEAGAHAGNGHAKNGNGKTPPAKKPAGKSKTVGARA
jgi:hypothetical protein